MTSIEFFGEQFVLREKVSEYALLKFARAAKAGQDGDTLEGMASLLDLVEKCITVEDWSRFDKTAADNDASSAQLTEVLKAAFGKEAERPTGQSSDSSDGLTDTPPSSDANSVDKGLEHFAGRPDLQLAVLHARSA